MSMLCDLLCNIVSLTIFEHSIILDVSNENLDLSNYSLFKLLKIRYWGMILNDFVQKLLVQIKRSAERMKNKSLRYFV